MGAEGKAPAGEVPRGIDLPALERFFAASVPGFNGALRVALIAGGRSNLTYVAGDGEREWVVRRPPLGHVLPTAHDMSREYRMLSAFDGTDVPVPHPIAFCADEEVLGAPFYVMSKVEGIVIRTGEDARRLSAPDAMRCSRALVEVLAGIHAVDPRAVGLAGLGRPTGFLERQVRRWSQQWERSMTRPLPTLDQLAHRLTAAVPDHSDAAVLHGDYRLDNTILAAGDPGRIVAVVDWEMATFGDPLADLGLLLVYWGRGGAGLHGADHAISANPGFLDGRGIAAAYAEASGRDLAELDFYIALGYFKLAIILEGIHARYLQGKTVGEHFEHVGESVAPLVDAALEVADASALPRLRGGGQ